jgi:hypothetical protein
MDIPGTSLGLEQMSLYILGRKKTGVVLGRFSDTDEGQQFEFACGIYTSWMK